MSANKTVSLVTLACCFSAVWCLYGCGINGKVDRTITTYIVDPITAEPIKIVDQCTATYSNTSWGTADARSVHGCDAGGNAEGTDNTQLLAVPITTLQAIIGMTTGIPK